MPRSRNRLGETARFKALAAAVRDYEAEHGEISE